MKRSLEARPAATQQTQSDRHIARTPRQFYSVKAIAHALDFSSVDACRTWVRRNRLPILRRGRVILIDWRDVERVLRTA